MALNLANKREIVSQVAEVASKSLSVVAAEYSGLTVSQMTELRSKARKEGLHLQVVRNTLAKLALSDTDFDCLKPALTGQLVLIFSHDDLGAGARLVRESIKSTKLTVKALSLQGELLGPEQLEAVANLPTKEQALTSLACVIQAPISKFVQTLAEPHAKLVRTVAAVGDSKKDAA